MIDRRKGRIILDTRRAAEKAEESETDVGSQDLSELGGAELSPRGCFCVLRARSFLLGRGGWQFLDRAESWAILFSGG